MAERLVKVGRAVGREPASPEEARRIIGLPSRPGRTDALTEPAFERTPGD